MKPPFLTRNQLAGLIDYSQPKSVLSDYFSPIAINAIGSDQIELSELYFKGHAMASDKPVFRPFVRLAIKGTSEYEVVGLTQRQDFPGAIREYGETADWKVQQDAYFISDKALRIEYTLSPIKNGAIAAPNAIVFGGINQGEVKASARVLPFEKGSQVEIDFTRSYVMYVSKTQAEFRARVLIAGLEGFARTNLFDNVAVATIPQELADKAVNSVAPSDKFRYEGQLNFTRQSDGTYHAAVSVACEWQGAQPVHDLKSWSFDKAVGRWEDLFNGLPLPPADTVYNRRKNAQAMLTMAHAGVRSKGYGNFSETLGLLACAVTWASTDFFWDHMISAAALCAIDPEIQTSAVINFLQHCEGGRLSPGILMAFPLYGPKETPPDGCYAPIASWTVYKTKLCGNNKPDIAKLYPYLKALNRGWFANADRDGDGIPEWMNSGHPADNSPLYDKYSPKPGMTNFPLPPFVSVNLTTYLYQDCKILAEFAAELGVSDDVKLWKSEAMRLEKVLLEKCWNEEDLFFYDLDTDGKQNKVKTFFGLLPLWAGIPIGDEKAKEMIQRHSLNTDEFWGEVPFPSVAFNEPTYDPDGYWRGRTWPHVYFWNTEILVRYGFEKEAAIARERHLRIVWGDRNHVENLPTDWKQLNHPGEPHYNWGAAANYFMIQDWHKSPVQL